MPAIQTLINFEGDRCAIRSVPGVDRAIHLSATRLLSTATNPTQFCRLNIENRRLLASSGLVPGAHYRPEPGPEFLFLRRLENEGDDSLVVCEKLFSNRDGSTIVGSRVDVRRRDLADVLPVGEDLLVAYCAAGVLVTALPTRRNARRRWRRLVAAIERGELTTGSLYTGVGTLDAALHAGFAKAGISSRTLFANDNWPLALEAMIQDNPAQPQRAFAIGIQEIAALGPEAALEAPDLLVMGIPCKGASKLNIRDRALPEMHPAAGHQVLNVAMILQALRHSSPLLLIENVVDWSQTASCSMLRAVLHEQGYATALIGDTSDDGKYRGLNGADFGDFERRKRMALLAFPPEIAPFLDWSRMERRTNARAVSDIRVPEEQVPREEYGKGRCLALKAAKRRPNNIVEDSATTTPPLSSECFKQRPEDPKFRHPTDPTRSRLPLPEEHARLKGQPETLVRGIPWNSLAHTALGNGTTRKVWEQLSFALGCALRAAVA